MNNTKITLENLNKVLKTCTPILSYQLIDNGKTILFFWKGDSILWFQKRSRISVDEFLKLIKGN